MLPDLSVSSRGLLLYSNGHGSNYGTLGYMGQSVTNQIALVGQVLSVRWYFGAPRG